MCRELIYSLFIVLVLGLFGNALAEVNYEYYVQEPDGFPDIGGAWMPDFTIMTPLAAGQVGNFDISVRTQNEHFAFRFTGYLGIRTDGDYDFWSESDDGSQLFIGPTLVVDNPGWHGSPGGGAYGTTYLTRGFHEIVVTMFEHEGGEALTVYYQGPGIDRQIIPAAALVIDPDFPASPYPADDARRVSINTVLAWAPGNSATSHKVYFGTWEPPTYQLTQAGSTFDPGTLEYLTDYYWQIVETAGGTDWAGPAWHLKTEPDPATITDVDLLAWYKFDGDYTDSSGYGNHGSPYGSAIGFVSDPERGQVAAFNGSDDCVDLGVNPYFNPAGSFSISVWANIEAWTGTWGNVLVGKRGENGVSWQLRRFGGDPQLSFTTRGVGADDTRSNSTPTFGEWQHIAAVYDNAANTKHIYLDGIEDVVQTTNAGATVTPCAHNVYIGARATADNTGREGFFLGMLDEVRIYSRALTPAEIKDFSTPMIAWDPTPADGSAVPPKASGANLCMILKYEPGKGAVSHTGYFSENYDDVLDRVAGANLGEPPY
ncbi:MAG: hypothetical protein KAY65_12250, partial [Planctomycetes bacterium]|nr:hypothetical protein [Planctomycetota bacterium]